MLDLVRLANIEGIFELWEHDFESIVITFKQVIPTFDTSDVGTTASLIFMVHEVTPMAVDIDRSFIENHFFRFAQGILEILQIPDFVLVGISQKSGLDFVWEIEAINEISVLLNSLLDLGQSFMISDFHDYILSQLLEIFRAFGEFFGQISSWADRGRTGLSNRSNRERFVVDFQPFWPFRTSSHIHILVGTLILGLGILTISRAFVVNTGPFACE